MWSHEEDHACSKCGLTGSGSVGSTDRRDGSPRRSPWSKPLISSPKSPRLHVPWEWGWETRALTMKPAGLLGPQIRGQSSCEAVSFPSLPQGVNTTAGEGTGQVPHPPAPVDAQEGPPEGLPARSGRVKESLTNTFVIPALGTGNGSIMGKRCQQNRVFPSFPPPPGQTSSLHPRSSHCVHRSGIKDIITERQCQLQRSQQELSPQTQPAPSCLEHGHSLGLAHKPQTQPYTPPAVRNLPQIQGQSPLTCASACLGHSVAISVTRQGGQEEQSLSYASCSLQPPSCSGQCKAKSTGTRKGEIPGIALRPFPPSSFPSL